MNFDIGIDCETSIRPNINPCCGKSSIG